MKDLFNRAVFHQRDPLADPAAADVIDLDFTGAALIIRRWSEIFKGEFQMLELNHGLRCHMAGRSKLTR
jgi:hypothetical protein